MMITKNTIYAAVILILLMLTMCNSKEKLGTYSLNGPTGNSIILYKDSTFTETFISDTVDEKCQGQWLFVNQKDSIIAMTTLSCGTKIYTTGSRTLKIDGKRLVAVSE